MKSFPWHDWLRQHPLFASLTEHEIAALLRDEVSHEREYPQGSVLLRGGEEGDSVLLLGVGSVQIILEGAGSPPIPVAVLHAGEIIGEMAVLERRPRSATVVAQEPCVLLEVAGAEIRHLMDTHPLMQVQLYTLVRDRLRQWFQRLDAGESQGRGRETERRQSE
jgi:CRP/FNR family cyclic AMP-dependent transcriptional regulator